MILKSLSTLYPTFILNGFADEMSKEENARLSEVAWNVWRANKPTESKYMAGKSAGFYETKKISNLFVDYKEEPVVKKFASIVDKMCRDFLKHTYNYEFSGRIDMLCEPLCQDETTGTYGITPHTHSGKPIIVTYYPSANIIHREEGTCGGKGVNGEVNFYDPANIGKRVWPNLSQNFHVGSVFRVEVYEGLILAFEGHIPHDANSYEGGERVCIPVACYPKLPHKNLGVPLEDIL